MIRWRESFLVDIAIIDGDHKMAVALLNQLVEAREEGQARDVIDSILNILIENLFSHLQREERLMAFGHCVGLADHLERHKKFMTTVTEFLLQYDDNRVGIMDELVDFLKNWLVEHLGNGDTHLWSGVMNMGGPSDRLDSAKR